ncbi:hypothetical protein BC629DRAFT_1437782 [Irpex lacteus]|nr:hypothetical protein BC629DRAFT_1437782 [Irpex lacteus]
MADNLRSRPSLDPASDQSQGPIVQTVFRFSPSISWPPELSHPPKPIRLLDFVAILNSLYNKSSHRLDTLALPNFCHGLFQPIPPWGTAIEKLQPSSHPASRLTAVKLNGESQPDLRRNQEKHTALNKSIVHISTSAVIWPSLFTLFRPRVLKGPSSTYIQSAEAVNSYLFLRGTKPNIYWLHGLAFTPCPMAGSPPAGYLQPETLQLSSIPYHGSARRYSIEGLRGPFDPSHLTFANPSMYAMSENQMTYLVSVRNLSYEFVLQTWNLHQVWSADTKEDRGSFWEGLLLEMSSVVDGDVGNLWIFFRCRGHGYDLNGRHNCLVNSQPSNVEHSPVNLNKKQDRLDSRSPCRPSPQVPTQDLFAGGQVTAYRDLIQAVRSRPDAIGSP